MKISLINKVAIGFGIALLLFLIEGVAFYQSITRYIEISKLIKHTNACIAALEEVLTRSKDMGTYYSGYIITGDNRFLISFNASAVAINNGIEEIKRLEARNPGQIKRIGDLEALIGSKIELQRETIAIRRDNGFEAARERIEADTGNILMDGIQKIIQEIKDKEYEVLNARNKSSNQAGKNAIYIIIVGSIMVVVVVGGAVFGIVIDISERKRIEEANKGLIHELGERVKELTALHRASVILQDVQKTVPDLLKEIVDILPAAWRYPDITAARIRYDDIEVTTRNFEESGWSQRADFTTSGGRNGCIEVFYLKEMPREDEGPFVKEERNLMNSLSEILKSYLLRRQAENDFRDNRNLLQKVLETIPVGIWLLDRSGYIVYGNPEAQKIWEGSRYVGIEHYVEYKAWRADTEKVIDSEEWAGARAIMKGETTIDEEIKIEGFGGTQKIILNSAVPIRNEKQEIAGAIIVNQDITELRKARTEAEAASRAKSEFLANMSHEIRTPMNSIIGMADLLSETSLTEEQKKYLDIFRRAGENLLSLLNDILDLSKVEAGRLELEETDFDLNETTEKIMEMMTLRAGEKGLELSCDISPDVPQFLRGDPNRLRQILVNLIGNSVKFTNEGEVTLKVSMNKTEGARDKDTVSLLFSVRDTGIGIPADKLETIFESFSQAHSSISRKYGGTGLGLTISRRLVEMMGGRIWVESTVGKGSIFYFTANFGTSTMQRTKGTSSLKLKAEREKRLLILLVDDSEDNRILIQSYLRNSPHKVDTARNGEEAVARFKKERYDLVLMDMQMPVMDGYAATGEIRKWEAETGKTPVPIIALTAYALKEDAEKSLEAGCTSHLSKPIKKGDLLEAIDKYAGTGGLKRETEGHPPKISQFA